MRFVQDRNVVQTLASDGADEPFREGVLPRAPRSREDFTDPHALHAVLECMAVDPVAIAKEIRRCAVIGKGLYDLLGGPVGGGVLGHVEVDDASAMVNQHDENKRTRKRAVGTVKKSRETRSRTWLARNVRQL